MDRGKQQLQNLYKVSVRNENVSKIGLISSLSESVLELDLQDNLIWDWNEVMSHSFAQQPSECSTDCAT